MFFSTKLTLNLIHFFEDRKLDFSMLEPSAEVLNKDPNAWIEASELEKFLRSVVRAGFDFGGEQILVQAGHNSSGKRVWGVFDSVLRMMPGPKEIFSQPQKLLSHFLSPEPKVESLEWSADSVRFSINFKAQAFPLCSFYLCQILESLPTYSGKPLSRVEWNGPLMQVSWSQSQGAFENLEIDQSISPDLIRELVNGLDSKGSSKLPDLRFEKISEDALALKHNLAVVKDSFNRAQQVISLILSQAAAEKKNTDKIQSALSKIEWDRTQTKFSETILEIQKILNRWESKDV